MAYNIVKDKNPMSINILKLQRYNFKYFSLEEVVFYEYLVIKAQSFGFKQFYHSTATIENETGLKRHKLDSIIAKFKKNGILDVEIKGFPLVKHFTVNFIKIQSLLTQIYQFAKEDNFIGVNNKLLDDFYNPFVKKYTEKNINKETIQNINKGNDTDIAKIEEKIFFSSDFIIFTERFNEELLNIKNEFDLNDVQLKYEE